MLADGRRGAHKLYAGDLNIQMGFDEVKEKKLFCLESTFGQAHVNTGTVV